MDYTRRDSNRYREYFKLHLDSNIIDILDCSLRRTDGSTTTDLSMRRLSRSEYLNIPVKSTTGRPSQFFLDKQNAAVLKISLL